MSIAVLTLSGAAKLLHLHPNTLAQRAKAGAVPAMRFGRRWLFSERLLLEFIETQSIVQCVMLERPEKPWISPTVAKTPPTGGSSCPPSMGSLVHYKKVLVPPTNEKHRNI